MWFGVSFEAIASRTACIFAAFTIAACAGMADIARNSPAYQEGFEDGCTTASTQGRPGQMKQMRNSALYEKDADYRAGFTSGVASCRMGPPIF
jgi:hypothetical protein